MFRRVGLTAMAATAVPAVTPLALSARASTAAGTRAAPAGLRSVATGLCLDSNANKQVYTHDRNGGSNQKWSEI